jgi:hypothetical protein
MSAHLIKPSLPQWLARSIWGMDAASGGRYDQRMQDPTGIPYYWDPVPHIGSAFGSLPAHDLRPAPEYVFRGKWEDRNWRNVPGPLYAGMTDSCWVGRQSAPRHILYGDDIEYESEFLYRQPHNVTELRDVLAGMLGDPWSGWACDGDSYWTPDLVRGWWRDRGRRREWIIRKQKEWGGEGLPTDEHVGAGLTDYLTYLDAELAGDLRSYIHFLETGRGPTAGIRLPAL